MMNPDYFKDLNQTVKFALAEDVGDVDITAELIDSENTATAEVITREEAVICGQPWVDEVFRQVDPKVKIEWQINEADLVEAERPLLRVSGLARSILTAERPALNFLQTLSGTATATHRYAQLISHTNADTEARAGGVDQACHERVFRLSMVGVGGGVGDNDIGLGTVGDPHFMAIEAKTISIRRGG